MKERGRNERKMVQGRKGGAGLTEGGLESQSVERWKWTDDGKWAGELGTRKAVWGYSQAYGWDRKPGEDAARERGCWKKQLRREGKQSMGGLQNCCIGLLVVGRCQALSGITRQGSIIRGDKDQMSGLIPFSQSCYYGGRLKSNPNYISAATAVTCSIHQSLSFRHSIQSPFIRSP